MLERAYFTLSTMVTVEGLRRGLEAVMGEVGHGRQWGQEGEAFN